LLSRSDLTIRSTSCRYLAAHCYIKQGKYEQALATLGEQNPDHLLPSDHNSRRRLQHLNGGNNKHVTLRNGNTVSRKDRIEHSEERERDREQAKDIKFEAAMCHLRGLCYSKRNAFDRAKECFIKAVKIDVQCFEAFDQLMKNSLLKPNEELKLLEELDFEAIQTEDLALAQEAAQFAKLLYTTRLSKYASPSALSQKPFQPITTSPTTQTYSSPVPRLSTLNVAFKRHLPSHPQSSILKPLPHRTTPPPPYATLPTSIPST
jgi:anaphase-promoting complex subunit 6